MKTLILDNYDSFTYNLVHIVEQFTDLLLVKRNDQIEIEAISEFDQIIISPGPGIPSEAGISMEVIKTYGPKKKILGVCLGLQAIAEAYGGRLLNLTDVMHGVSSQSFLDNESTLFKGLPAEITVGHYHSWVIDPLHMPKNFDITATNEDGLIMAIEHKNLSISAVQFHPESILTPHGSQIIENWVNS